VLANSRIDERDVNRNDGRAQPLSHSAQDIKKAYEQHKMQIA